MNRRNTIKGIEKKSSADDYEDDERLEYFFVATSLPLPAASKFL